MAVGSVRQKDLEVVVRATFWLRAEAQISQWVTPITRKGPRTSTKDVRKVISLVLPIKHAGLVMLKKAQAFESFGGCGKLSWQKKDVYCNV